MLQSGTLSGFFQNGSRIKGKQLLSPATVDVHSGSRMHTVKILLNWHEIYATAMIKTWQRLKIKKVTLLINPRRACSARVTVVVLCVCVSTHTCRLTHRNHKREIPTDSAQYMDRFKFCRFS